MLAGVVSVPPEFFFNIPVHWYIYLSCNGAELKEKKELLHGSSPPNFKGDLKISDQNNCVWGGDLSKKLNLTGEANFKRAPKILGGSMNPNDVMVVVLKDILSCLLSFGFIYIV